MAFQNSRPLDSWEGLIYSEEKDNAIKYGYQFEIKHGMLIKKLNLKVHS
jgi:hypothetical protein